MLQLFSNKCMTHRHRTTNKKRNHRCTKTKTKTNQISRFTISFSNKKNQTTQDNMQLKQNKTKRNENRHNYRWEFLIFFSVSVWTVRSGVKCRSSIFCSLFFGTHIHIGREFRSSILSVNFTPQHTKQIEMMRWNETRRQVSGTEHTISEQTKLCAVHRTYIACRVGFVHTLKESENLARCVCVRASICALCVYVRCDSK